MPTRLLNQVTVEKIERYLAGDHSIPISYKVLDFYRVNHFTGDNEKLMKLNALIEQAERDMKNSIKSSTPKNDDGYSNLVDTPPF